jgi:hypothetical protein
MLIFGRLQQAQFITLNDIPCSLLFPPETRYSFACAIMYHGGHYTGISLDLNTSQGNHVICDEMKLVKSVQVVSLDDPISKCATGFSIIELWYVKLKGSLVHQ